MKNEVKILTIHLKNTDRPKNLNGQIMIKLRY